ncbi:MAG: hypothetical protein HC914_13605 [Chloroflexaceae bacterium]|nr:hypothetical protein [Chloroflexaceae bacterium]
MSRLVIQTLGTFQITLDGTVVTRFDSNKARALLLYLAVEATRPHSRDTLIHLFWADLPEAEARHNLRQTLHRLRQALSELHDAPHFLLVTRHTIQFNPTSEYWLDATAFRALRNEHASLPEGTSDLHLLEQLTQLYQGDFLGQSYLVNTVEFETWLLEQRTDLRRQATLALEELATAALHIHNYGQAEAAARRLLQLDPLAEQPNRLLMHIFTHMGQPNAALQHYEGFRGLLLHELGLAPEPATTALYQRIQQMRERGEHESLALPPCPFPGMLPFGEHDHARFFGREAEAQTLVDQLAHAPIQSVIGASGSGKSSLVFAGLIPRLHQIETGWHICTVRPGATPLQALYTALATTTSAYPNELAPTETPVALAALCATVPRPLLLVVDQFEEIFTVGQAEAPAFQQAIHQIAASSGCAVVLTVRADFYHHLMDSPLWPMIQPWRIELTPLTAEKLRDAITRAVATVDVTIEPALLERLIVDAANEPGVLPLLQETLVLLWQRLERQVDAWGTARWVLPRRAYDALEEAGYTGLRAVLTRHADTVLYALSAARQALARRLFLRLIQFGGRAGRYPPPATGRCIAHGRR